MTGKVIVIVACRRWLRDEILRQQGAYLAEKHGSASEVDSFLVVVYGGP